MLGVSDLEMEQFVNCWMGSTMDVVNAVRKLLSNLLRRPKLTACSLRSPLSRL